MTRLCDKGLTDDRFFASNATPEQTKTVVRTYRETFYLAVALCESYLKIAPGECGAGKACLSGLPAGR